jgi:hypothetical protein
MECGLSVFSQFSPGNQWDTVNMFPPGSTASNIIRQWVELSQWFPSLTPAMGNLAGNGIIGTTDLPFANYSPPVTSPSAIVLTHSYLYETRSAASGVRLPLCSRTFNEGLAR